MTPIVLIGPMGCGKSTIGRSLANHLKCEFVDTDRLIERRCGADIPWIFDIEGEEGFRLRETKILSECLDSTAQVIATGGGVILHEENRKNICANSIAVFINASIDDLFERISRESNRPLLQQPDPKAAYEKIYAERFELYREVADIEVNSSNHQSAYKTAMSIVEQMKSLANK